MNEARAPEYPPLSGKLSEADAEATPVPVPVPVLVLVPETLAVVLAVVLAGELPVPRLVVVVVVAFVSADLGVEITAAELDVEIKLPGVKPVGEKTIKDDV